MKKIKQIVAILVITLLVGMYVAAFIMALTDNPETMSMFKGCIACTIFVPAAAYCFICLHRYAMFRSGREDSYSPDSLRGDSASSDDKQDTP